MLKLKILLCVIGFYLVLVHCESSSSNESDIPITTPVHTRTRSRSRQRNRSRSSYYISYPKKDTWLGAYQICQDKNQSLISIETKAKQKEINALVLKMRWNLKYKTFWTSGTDQDSEGHYKWSTTGNNISYYNWQSGQPHIGNNEHCLLMKSLRKRKFKWYNRVCSLRSYYICETIIADI